MKFSTDDIQAKRFQPHGRVEFSVLNENIVLYHALGPFNTELGEALAEVEENILPELKKKQGKWFDIVIFYCSCLATDDSLEFLRGYLTEVNKMGLAANATAFVLQSDVEGSKFMVDKFKHCYESAGIKFSTFSNRADAISWIESVSNNSISCPRVKNLVAY